MNSPTDGKELFTHCPLCPRSCPADRPSCGRGRAYFHSSSPGDGYPPPDDPNRDACPHAGKHPRHGDKSGRNSPPLLWDDGTLMPLFARCFHALRHCGGRSDAQQQVLQILSRNPEGISQRRLQDLLGIQPAGLSELAGRLEDRGLLTRSQEGDDRTGITLFLTEAGRAAAATPCADPFAALSKEEQEALRTILQKLLQAQEAPSQFPQEQAGETACG